MPEARRTNLSLAALVIAILSTGLSIFSFSRISKVQQLPSPSPSGILERIERENVIHAGYGVYPPYTMENPNTKEVSGFSVEIVEQIAKELKCKIVWHRLNWNTMSADLKRGEYDLIADPIFETIPRAREFAFTEPYAYFADGIAVVRKDENRFSDFASLDREDITIVVGQGWASETLVRSRFSKPKIVAVQTTTDLLQLFNDVAAGRADVAIADAADAKRYVAEHPDLVKALWLDNPPAGMPAGFALRPQDTSGAEFLTVCLRNLRTTGFLASLARRYEVTLVPPDAGGKN